MYFKIENFLAFFQVEYDMDEEDVAWLNIINEKRSSENLSKISEDNFELLMDRLEKESYFHVQVRGEEATVIFKPL